MKYGVLVCPKCGMAKGVETKKKTTTCQCGREIVVRKQKLRFLTDSPLELAGSVAKANAAIRGGEQMPSERKSRKKDPYSVLSERATATKDRTERFRIVAKGLTDLKGEFSVEDMNRVASLLGRESGEEIVRLLQESNMIYEVQDGKFRTV